MWTCADFGQIIGSLIFAGLKISLIGENLCVLIHLLKVNFAGFIFVLRQHMQKLPKIELRKNFCSYGIPQLGSFSKFPVDFGT